MYLGVAHHNSLPVYFGDEVLVGQLWRLVSMVALASLQDKRGVHVFLRGLS